MSYVLWLTLGNRTAYVDVYLQKLVLTTCMRFEFMLRWLFILFAHNDGNTRYILYSQDQFLENVGKLTSSDSR